MATILRRAAPRLASARIPHSFSPAIGRRWESTAIPTTPESASSAPVPPAASATQPQSSTTNLPPSSAPWRQRVNVPYSDVTAAQLANTPVLHPTAIRTRTVAPGTGDVTSTKSLEYPYVVKRTPSNNLPVYERLVMQPGHGGRGKLRGAEGKPDKLRRRWEKDAGLGETLVRKVSGDVHALRMDLIEHVGVKPEWIKAHPMKGHLVIKVGACSLARDSVRAGLDVMLTRRAA